MEMANEVGNRFHPTDEELVNHFLRQKMLGHDDEVQQIPEIDVLSSEPWEIPDLMMPNNSNDQVWYFFSRPQNINSNGNRLRVKRTTNGGFWKVTGKDRKIKDIGVKRTLVFYQGGSPNVVRTKWVMHEYNPTFNFPVQSDFVVCKLKTRSDA